jgi:hypothetical protein
VEILVMGWLIEKVTGNPMLILYIAGSAFLFGLASGGGAAWTVQNWRMGALKNEQQAAMNNAQKDLLAEQASHHADIVKGENQHAEDQLANNALSSRLSRLQHVAGICASRAARQDQAAKDSNGAGGLLPNRVDAAFAKLQDGLRDYAGRCDQLNIDARKANVENGLAP